MTPAAPVEPALFCGIELGARIERAEAQMIARATEAAGRGAGDASAGPFVLPLAGGVACFAQPGAPMNKVVGLGFAGAPALGDLDAVERAYAARACPVQVELCSLADPAVGTLLSERGYRLTGFENLLARSLAGQRSYAPPPGTTVSRCPPDQLASWVEMMVLGFGAPDREGRASREPFPEDLLTQTMTDLASAGDFIAFLARREGAPVGGASLRITDGIAQLAGATTLPEHRRRGVHTALLAARLADAAGAGCDLAVVTTSPGSKSQGNAIRQHFSLLYTRAILVKPVAPA